MMNFAQISAMSGFASRLDADYQAVLDRGTALGYTLPSVAQRTKQNQLVLDLKGYGIWTLLDVFYNFATDGDSDFATLNWKAPSSYQVTKVNSPTFTNNQGFDFNGTTQYLNTNWAPGTNGINYTQNSASIGLWINDGGVNLNRIDIGCSNNADGITNSVVINSSDAAVQLNTRINDNTTHTIAIASSLGLSMAQRRASNDKRSWKNGAQVGTTQTTASTTPPTVNLFLGASNGNGTATLFASREISMVFAGASLSGSESNLYTAWNTYFTSL